MIIYPRGSGGSWLNNLIWHLENNDWTLPRVNTVFDRTPRSSVPFSHSFEIPNPARPDQVQYYPRSSTDILFSCTHRFNHYLNNATKVKYHIHRLDQQPWLTQFFELSNGARYYFANAHYHEHYCKNIDLDYSLIFLDPNHFVQSLFALLNKLNLRYTANADYVHSSIEYYQSTCANPSDHFDNPNSVLWLAACHAVALLDQLTITEPIQNLASAQQLLEPLAEHCQQRIQPLMFLWKK